MGLAGELEDIRQRKVRLLKAGLLGNDGFEIRCYGVLELISHPNVVVHPSPVAAVKNDAHLVRASFLSMAPKAAKESLSP